jgi:hypothetical protein
MRRLAVSLGCLIASVIWVAPAYAQELTLTRSAESGVDTRISHERAWDRNCGSLAVKVSVTKNPAHGTVSVAGNTGTCAGKTITGSTIRYKSNSGFRGKDSVSYKVVIGDRPSQLRVITINVK